MKKTKIICTVGPSTDNVELLEQMLAAGMDIARFNFSHGNHANHAQRIAMVRLAAAKIKKPLALIADTKGPEMRLGNFAQDEVHLAPGDEFCLTTEDVIGTQAIAHVNYAGLPVEVQIGNAILLADGLLSLEVIKIAGTKIYTKVVH
ncbi:MAG: pyruvate kinase, partial [Acidaminococcaceae bacterium]